MATLPSILALFLLLLSLLSLSQARVETFTYVNEGELGPYITENGADYRALPPFSSPFQMCFYNTTPGEYYLALRMATLRSESFFRWVWRANPFAPVPDNATFSLRPDGDLVLANPDGKIVWSTGTANKDVVRLEILPTGNIVLSDSKGKFVWQSFDHPTDTLLVGQSLRPGGPTSLVSRNGGAYSVVLESKGLAMYINNVSSAKPLLYGRLAESSRKVTSITFACEPQTDSDSGAYAYELDLVIGPSQGTAVLARPKYNATLSFLRIEEDGNLVVYTYYDPVDYRAWEKTYAYFYNDLGQVSTCMLPSKCGGFGLCDEEMCVACPTKDGLLGWSESCSTPKLAMGKKCHTTSSSVDYYKVVGVENFLTSYGKGTDVNVEECKKRCSSDCKCLGFFYWELESKCWFAPLLGTLAKVSNSSHVAYVKFVK
ncbi:epidermis-specific secreted glycoprotein EP1-like [Iris pallida]|uniref:Epidermis-specific secreted glycoprotein EP1-like n=1 Tax=Iris pallida TaxID=29817 RepID=A0AAX6E827_IRIPA|nr:epidermis-specific secreted glycoprotein EP1-like [Iris pallida]